MSKWILSIIAILLLAIGAQLPAAAAPPKQEPQEKPSLLSGAVLWFENCAACHGVSGAGDGSTAADLEFAPANFADPEPAKTRIPAEMFITARDGRMDKFMPPWGAQLSEPEIWDAITYAQSLSTSPAELKAGAFVFSDSCAECHGAEGVSAEIDLTQPGLLVNASNQNLFDALRGDNKNHAPLTFVSDEELWQSLVYIRTLSWEVPVLDGILRGQAINQTTGQPAANVSLTLYALSSTGDAMQTYSATTDASGNFLFENLSRDHNVAYTLEGVYKEISYFTPEPTVFLPDAAKAELNLSVYDTTESNDDVFQNSFHRIMDFGNNVVRIADVYVFGNSGNRTYIGQPGSDGLPETVKIALPDNAENVAFRSGTARQTEPGYYSESQAIIPGQESNNLIVTYDVPFDDSNLTLETPLFYDVATANILVANQGALVSSPQLESLGVETIQGQEFQQLTGTDLQAGSPFVMELEQLDQIQFQTFEAPPTEDNIKAETAAVNADQNILRWLLLGLGTLIAGFAILFTERRQPAPASKKSLDEEKTRLLILLNELERIHEAGEIDAQTYRQIRNKNRTLLKEVLERSRT